MSASKPLTLLSFIYNTTAVPAYRTEMHMDMRRAFERFAIKNGVAQTACFDIEKAAYGIRTSTTDVQAIVPISQADFQAAKGRMSAACPVLFAELVDELVQLIVNKAKFDDTPLAKEIDVNAVADAEVRGFGPVTIATDGSVTTPAGTPFLLLAYVYYFFHFQQVRDAIRKSTTSLAAAAQSLSAQAAVPLDPAGQPQIVGTMLTLGRMMDSPEVVPADAVRPHAKLLCDLLAAEYEGPGWFWCW